MGPESLTDGVVTLRPWRLLDARWYVAAARDPAIQHWTSERPNLTGPRFRRVLRSVRRREDVLGYAICDAGTGRRLGNIGLVIEGDVADAGYWVAQAERGRGIAAKALALLTAWALENLAVRAVVLWTRVGNTASQRVAERCGFRRAPHLDGRRMVKGEMWDIVYFVREPK